MILRVRAFILIAFILTALTGSVSSGAAAIHVPAALTKAAPDSCPYARAAVAWYRGRYAHHQLQRGAAVAQGRKPHNCADARYLAKVWISRAHQARVSTAAYFRHQRELHAYHYNWWQWLPAKWQRIARCETGYQGGDGPGESRWDWNSGAFQGAFGFATSTWDQYKPAGAPSEAYLATPRQQYQAALNVYHVHGYGAWGCAGA